MDLNPLPYHQWAILLCLGVFLFMTRTRITSSQRLSERSRYFKRVLKTFEDRERLIMVASDEELRTAVTARPELYATKKDLEEGLLHLRERLVDDLIYTMEIQHAKLLSDIREKKKRISPYDEALYDRLTEIFEAVSQKTDMEERRILFRGYLLNEANSFSLAG